MKLFGDKASSTVRKIQVVADYVGVPLAVAPPAADAKSCSKDNAVKLETPQGRLCGSNTCVRYFARMRPEKFAYGESFHNAAEVDSWLDFVCCQVEWPLSCPSCTGDRKALIKSALSMVNTHLATNTFLVGERITVADLTLVAVLASADHSILSDDITSSMKNYKRWYKTLSGQKSVKKFVGDIEAQKKDTKENKAPKKVDQKKDEEDDVEQPPKPTKCPLDDLPPSTFNMDAWKRCYSNTKDLYGEAMKYFWENYDPSGFSIWYMKYEKLEGECTVPFVTSNQLNGFLQRADPSLRKYAFGNFNVMGSGNSYDVIGIWLFRGTDVAPQMKDHPSYEYHKWRKLDHTNEADKKLVADYWCSETTCEGIEISDSKVYK